MSALSRVFLLLPTVLTCITWSLAVDIEDIHEWKYIDYVWRSESDKQDAIDNGEYNSTKIIPFDFQEIRDGRVLVTTPRFHNNPASLSTVSQEIGSGGPLLKPYPNWDWHKAGRCSGITSAQRLFLDDCNRLWLVDTGKIGDDQICPAKLLEFDPETDRLLKSVEIPFNVSHSSKDPSKGMLEVQIVETNGEFCEKTWVYMGDPAGHGLVIWNGEDIWRLENDDVYAPDPTATTYDAVKKNVTLDIGIASFALTPPGFIDEPYLLMRPYSSFKDYAVSLEDLHNSKSCNNVTYYKGNITLTSQELARVFTKSGIIFGGLARPPNLSCWNLENPLAPEYIAALVEDEETLRFISAAKIVESNNPNDPTELQFMSNRLPKFAAGTMDFNDINFRISRADVTSLINGTVCESKRSRTVSTIEDKFFFK